MNFIKNADINDYIYTGLFLVSWFTIVILFMKAF